MGKSKKNKQKKSPPKNEQKSGSINPKGKEAVSHPQNLVPPIVSEEEQHLKKEQVTQSAENVDHIEATAQSAVLESSQDLQTWPSLSSSSSFSNQQKNPTKEPNKIDSKWVTTTSPHKADGSENNPYSRQSDKHKGNDSKKEDYPKRSNEQIGRDGHCKDPDSLERNKRKGNDFKKGDYRKRSNERIGRDGHCKDSDSQERNKRKGNDFKKEDYRKRSNERIGRDEHCKGPDSQEHYKKEDGPKQYNERKSSDGRYEGNRTRDNWRGNDHQSDDKGFDQFRKIVKQMIREDSFKKVIEVEGDLFNMPVEYSLAHCVAEDMKMGSGIAVRFSQQFKRLGELYDQRAKQGGLAILEDKGRYIYYLVTKRVSNGKPTLQTMWNSLQKLKQHIEDNNVKKLAIPRIGCGLDRLEWSDVKNMLEYTFRETDVEITVCNLQQQDDDGPRPTSGLPYKQNKCYIKNVEYSIAGIEGGTAIIYFGAEDDSMFDDIEDLDKKFRIRMDYKNARKRVGEVVQTYKQDKAYCLYGCIVRKTKEDPFDFINFQKCITQLKKMNKDYYYVAFQAFLDSDDLIVSKIGNMLSCSLANVDVYICWGGKMKAYMPQDRSNNFY